MNGRIRKLLSCQVWDDRGCFFVRMEPLKEHGRPVFYRGQRVMTDAFGARFVVAD